MNSTKCLFIFIFLFRTKLIVRKDTWMRKTSVTVMVPFDYSFVQSSFSAITRHVDNNILKDTPQLKISRVWIKIRASSFIKTLVNIMKQKSTNVPGKLSVAEKSKPALQRILHQNRWHFTYFYTLLFLLKKPIF